MRGGLDDDDHVAEQQRALRRAGGRRSGRRSRGPASGSTTREAALYLWATRDEPCWDTVGRLADLGILVAPGDFYGPAGARHVRVAFTATDERVAAAAARLAV